MPYASNQPVPRLNETIKKYDLDPELTPIVIECIKNPNAERRYRESGHKVMAYSQELYDNNREAFMALADIANGASKGWFDV